MTNNTLTISCIFPYASETIFSKYSNKEALSRWWGPHGFRNTFESFDFNEGGKWIFLMSDEKNDYYNEMVFHIIEKDHIIMEHTVEPLFSLEVILEKNNENETRMTWISTFKNPEFLEKMRDFLTIKNGENFDRLGEELKNF